MTAVAYACLDPRVDPPFDGESCCQPIRRLYLDQTIHQLHRPQLQQLLHDCAEHPPETVFVRQLADLGDTASEVFACIETLESQGICVHSLDQRYRTPTPTEPGDRSQLLALADSIQAQHRSRQLRAGHAQNRIDTQPPPGRAPYGYRRGRHRYALDRAVAPAVKDFFENFLLYGSVRGAVRHLEKAYGKHISASTAQRWLTHPVYRGDLLYKDGSIIRDTHTPIISREEAAQVDRLLRRNRRLPPKTASAERSLAGLVYCQTCQNKLRVSKVTRPRQTKEYLYLRPTECDRAPRCKAIPYESVLQQAIALICAELPMAAVGIETSPVESVKQTLQEERRKKQDVLDQIPDLEAAGVLDQASASLRAYTLKNELSSLEQKLSQLPPANFSQVIQTLASPQFWDGLSEVERRVYLREFVKRVLIARDGEDWGISVEFVF